MDSITFAGGIINLLVRLCFSDDAVITGDSPRGVLDFRISRMMCRILYRWTS